MKHLKSAKKFLALFVVVTVLTGTMLVANAGSCSHGEEESKFETYRTVTIGCISTGTHQCYVGGVSTSCETYCYKFLNYTKCTMCGAEGDSYYSYGPTMHQYNH